MGRISALACCAFVKFKRAIVEPLDVVALYWMYTTTMRTARPHATIVVGTMSGDGVFVCFLVNYN